MEQEKLEQVIMQLIVNSGDARSLSMESIELAKESKYEEAKAKLLRAKEQLNLAHNAQTDMITREVNGEVTPMSLLMCHGQDHLMTAMVVVDLAGKFIELYERIDR